MGEPVWVPAYIALGSNLDQPQRQVQLACAQLAQLSASNALVYSSLYHSAPMGPQDQPAYVNAVAGLLTTLPVLELLSELQNIERTMGKQASSLRWGPRVIDLDLLLYGTQRSDTAKLQLPHPGLLLRNFVLVPLAEIAPQLILPNGMTASACVQQLGMLGLERI
ncbi:MAG: 2-amino-4-hydroxy-6-hydroxymethyldihydropteridine diphosphokinase [Steroidobacteraceae bacterium]